MEHMVKNLLSTTEVAKMLGISRIAVFKKVKKGEIPAQKVGRNFVIARRDLPTILGSVLKEASRREIERAVHKTVREYGETLRLLGKE